MDEIIFTQPLTPLYAGPDEGGQRADEALCGMAASVVGAEGGMLRVRTRYRYEGYVARECVARVASASDWERSASRVVIAPAADVMSSPEYGGSVIATLPRGSLLSVGGGRGGEASGWLAAVLADGSRGYVRSHSVREIRLWIGKEDGLRANVAADARLYLGAQYRWGGKTHYGVDCSGLASMAYMLNGLYIFRDSRIEDGYPVREIPAGDAREGDLLYWKGHVAVYLGGGRYIHSTGFSSGVVINSLDPSQPDFRADLSEVMMWGSVFSRKS